MKISAFVFIFYGILVLAGGIIGYMKANSQPSLIMGSVFALLLIASGIALLKQSDLAYFAGVALSVILTFFFSYRFFITQNFMPAGMMAIVSLVVVIIAIINKLKS